MPESEAVQVGKFPNEIRNWPRLQLAITACVAIFVCLVESRLALVLAGWNVTPLLLALGAIAVGRSSYGSQEVRVGGTVFWATQAAFMAYLHAAWLFDWQQVASSSSTAGLIFFVTPLYSVVGGFLIAGASMAAVAVLKKMTA